MKGQLGFDPREYDYGTATPAVRQLLVEWADVDWFEPASGAGADARARGLFQEHHALARAYLPEVFPVVLRVESSVGGWGDFGALRERVRAHRNWDWKFSALKRLSSEHSKARGWSPAVEADRQGLLDRSGPPRPGNIFVRYGDHVFWQAPWLRFKLDEASHRDRLCRWYVTYANMDMVECIEWQLAEQSDKLEGNPFVPLLRCYATGCLPFALDPTTVVLFAFTAA